MLTPASGRPRKHRTSRPGAGQERRPPPSLERAYRPRGASNSQMSGRSAILRPITAMPAGPGNTAGPAWQSLAASVGLTRTGRAGSMTGRLRLSCPEAPPGPALPVRWKPSLVEALPAIEILDLQGLLSRSAGDLAALGLLEGRQGMGQAAASMDPASPGSLGTSRRCCPARASTPTCSPPTTATRSPACRYNVVIGAGRPGSSR